MRNKILYTISLPTEVSTYWYGKYDEFVQKHPDEFKELTFGEYLGEQVLTNMKLLFELQAVPEEPEVTVEFVTEEGEVDES